MLSPPLRLDFSPPVQLVRDLMREYADSLGIDLRFQNFERELAELPGRYAAPYGCLVVAYSDGQPAGCGAYRLLAPGICEMKRLYVRPGFRGRSIGRDLSVALLEKASQAGYRTMRLDTLGSLHAAIALYRSLGFREIPPYNQSPLTGCLFFEATLPRYAVP